MASVIRPPESELTPVYISHPDKIYSEKDIQDKNKAFKLDGEISSIKSITLKSYFSDLKDPKYGIELYEHKLVIGQRFEINEYELDEFGNPIEDRLKVSNSYPDDNIYVQGDYTLKDYYLDKTKKINPIGKIYANLGIIEFFTDLTPIAEGVDNIIVEYITAGSETINEYKFGTKFSIGNDERILLYNNDIIYFSGYDDFLYIPYINTTKIGNSGSKIVGFSKLSDATLAAFKDYNDDNSLYYINATSVDVDGFNKIAFTVKGGATGESALNNNTSCMLANDSLFLSENGVQSLVLGQNITTNERYTFERSGFINSKLLKKTDFNNAAAIVYKNRYYLAIDNEVFVADARFKTSARDEDMNDTFNYEWWHWENVPVKYWMINNDKLCFVDKENRLCEFTDDFTDVTLNYLSAGDWTDVENSDNYMHINQSKANLLKEGNLLIVNDTYYKITDINKYNCYFRLKDYSGNIVNTQGEFYSNFNNSFYICDISNVISEWNSPIINMGTSIYSKNLLSTTLTFEPNIEGNVKFGYLTRRSGEHKYKDSNLAASEGFDFENVDFTDFSFNVNFACSRTLKTRVRNYNYIQFRVISDDNKDFALNNFVITYNYGRKNKGVR